MNQSKKPTFSFFNYETGANVRGKIYLVDDAYVHEHEVLARILNGTKRKKMAHTRNS